MRQHSKLYFAVSILAVFLSAWAVNTARSASDVVSTGTAVTTGNLEQGGAVAPEFSNSLITDSTTATGPGTDALNRMLDGVNLRPSTERISVETGPVTEAQITVDGVNSVREPTPQGLNESQGPSRATAENFITASIKLVSSWLSSLLSSIFHS